MNFFDPLWTSDGQPYGPERFKRIAKERYLISKYINTSYTDTSEITPTEREYLMEFILEDKQNEQEQIRAARSKLFV